MNPLTNVGTPGIRKALYGVAFVANAAWTAYEGAHGDWHAAVAPAIGAVLFLTAAANASETPEDD